MDTRIVREEQVSQGLSAGASSAKTGDVLRDRSVIIAMYDLQKKQREEEELDAKIKEGKQLLESLQQRIDELQMEVKTVGELYLGFDLFLKNEHVGQVAGKAKRKKEEGLKKVAEIKRLEQEYAEMMERKQEVERQVQRTNVYLDFMERVAKMTKFKDVDLLTVYLESLLHFRDKFYRQESDVQKQVDQQRKAVLTLEDKNHFMRLHKNNQLSDLQTELEKARSETLIWERNWNHIQETAAKKILLLGQIKMATFNLYEMIDDKIAGEEGVDMNDTEKQLDRIMQFILDHEDIVRQHQASLQRQNEGQKRNQKVKKDHPKSTHSDVSIKLLTAL